ncbi:GTPase-associated protein 1-related protein [Saccharopolyspora griseoalba]|uniref:GTPase-associated protein 1-related protein n=1 Tax=Saccharopolyspora griseoalba TaxID=1431848 RepID=A0ABW2LIC6_9PSEU
MSGREFRSRYGDGAPPVSGSPALSHDHDQEGYRTARTTAEGRTHSLTTADAQLYGPIRPAQLWGAPWWADEPDAPEVQAEPEPGPLTAEELRGWVLERDGAALLTALHSAIDRALDGGPRVVLVAPDVEFAVRWIAAATLLLPQERALRASFSAFAGDTGAQVLAAAEPGEHPGAVRFDLAAAPPEVEPTGSAKHWVPRFLVADPVDVVDAVELAHQFARARSEASAGQADRLAAGLIVLGEHASPADCRPLAAWLRDAPAPSGTDVRGAVLSAVLAAEPPRAVLVDLAENVGEHTGRVRIALLRDELDEILHGDPVAEPQPLEPLPWTEEEAEQARILIRNAAAAAPAERFDLLLRTATRFGVPLRAGGFAEDADRFVRWWADHPRVEVVPGEWPCREELVGRLRDLLAHRLAGPEADNVRRDVAADWWPLLLDAATEPGEPLDAEVIGAAVAAGGPAREQVVTTFAEQLRDPGRGLPEAVFAALFGAAEPEVDELHRLVAAMPATAVPEPVAQRVFAALDRAEVTAPHLDLLRMLGHHIGDRGGLRELWTDDGRVRSWLTGYPKRGAQAGSLRGISARVIEARGPEILGVLRELALGEALGVVTEAGEGLQRALARELPALWRDERATSGQRDRAVALAFLTGWQDAAAAEVRTAFDRELEGWAREHDRAAHRRISRLLRGVGADDAAAWHEWLHNAGADRGSGAPGRGRWWRRRAR